MVWWCVPLTTFKLASLFDPLFGESGASFCLYFYVHVNIHDYIILYVHQTDKQLNESFYFIINKNGSDLIG